MVLIRRERRPDYAVHWRHDDVEWALHDGLVIALVPSRYAFDGAFHLVSTKLNEIRRRKPGAGGRLVLDTAGEWIWPDTQVIDFDRYTRTYNLAHWRISLALADGESLEAAGNRQFAEHSEALAWSQHAVTDQ
ncbi:hypothetical protein [Paraburkholderia sp. HD33-4]|uniref:hypothetical protein n=1 Tax=Paraburkholderia sp. HD33-4 TaxID=2883242 RepID=UPI001F2B7877|nr:hypothetical protein [Paraburkholderia sp. HD33-4]